MLEELEINGVIYQLPTAKCQQLVASGAITWDGHAEAYLLVPDHLFTHDDVVMLMTGDEG